ncbi:hypothetical protein [Nitratireductor basaltis]|nr:hypothetical protein [Nitratireductor basaltis]
MPDRDLWVAVALLEDGKNENFKGGKNAQKAGILCGEGAFQRFIGANNPEQAAIRLRQRCGVESRIHLDHDEDAAREFRNLVTEYENWTRGIAA